MEPDYLVRTTLWHDDRGDLVQVSVAVLDSAWEPLSERTTSVGPFADADDVLIAAGAAGREWLAANGVQRELLR